MVMVLALRYCVRHTSVYGAQHVDSAQSHEEKGLAANLVRRCCIRVERVVDFRCVSARQIVASEHFGTSADDKDGFFKQHCRDGVVNGCDQLVIDGQVAINFPCGEVRL